VRATREKWLERQRRCWDFAASGCLELADWLEHHYKPITSTMLRLAPPPQGGRILDVACGTGGLTRVLAAHAAYVVGTDLAPEMVAAAERACEDLHNVAFEAIGAEDPVDTPRPFNAVYSRLGIMFCADVGLALQRIAEVVQPEGTLCIAVWGPASQNQWSEVPSRILIEHQGLNPPGPDDPSAFHMADPDAVRAALREAGWRTYAQEPVLVPGWEDGGPEQTWERLRATAGPIGALFERTPEDERPALRQRILSALAEVPSGGLTGLAWVHAARRS